MHRQDQLPNVANVAKKQLSILTCNYDKTSQMVEQKLLLLTHFLHTVYGKQGNTLTN